MRNGVGGSFVFFRDCLFPFRVLNREVVCVATENMMRLRGSLLYIQSGAHFHISCFILIIDGRSSALQATVADMFARVTS